MSNDSNENGSNDDNNSDQDNNCTDNNSNRTTPTSTDQNQEGQNASRTMVNGEVSQSNGIAQASSTDSLAERLGAVPVNEILEPMPENERHLYGL